MGKNTAVHRITITESEILGVIETLHHAQINGESSNADSLSFLKKLQLRAYEMHLGTVTPAYVATGRITKPAVSLDSLGATPQERIAAELSTAEEDELDRLDRQMREELAASGNSNVVLEERRTSDRALPGNGQEVGPAEQAGPSDEDLFKLL